MKFDNDGGSHIPPRLKISKTVLGQYIAGLVTPRGYTVIKWLKYCPQIAFSRFEEKLFLNQSTTDEILKKYFKMAAVE